MAKSWKSQTKRLIAQGQEVPISEESRLQAEIQTAPVDGRTEEEKFLQAGGLMCIINYSLQVGKPVITFIGKWTTRDFKNILRAMPRAYRQNQVNLRKQLDALKKQGA